MFLFLGVFLFGLIPRAFLRSRQTTLAPIDGPSIDQDGQDHHFREFDTTQNPTKMASETTVIREHPAATIKNWSLKLSTAPVDDAPEIGNSPQSLTSRTVSLFEQAKENAVRLLNRTWQKRHVRWDDQEWDVLEYHSNAYDTQSLMVSCGTVTMDKPESADRRVLLIWNKKTRAVSKCRTFPAQVIYMGICPAPPDGYENVLFGDTLVANNCFSDASSGSYRKAGKTFTRILRRRLCVRQQKKRG